MSFLYAVVPLDGVTPTKYGLLLDNDDKYKAIKKGLAKYCNIDPKNLLLVEVYGATVKVCHLLHGIDNAQPSAKYLLYSASSCSHGD